MSRWQKVRSHEWPDEHGEPVLRHTKYLRPDGRATFPWMHRMVFPETGIVRWFDGDGKDQGIVHPLLYRRDLFEQASRDEHAYICEGERDVCSGLDAGLLAVTAGAAGAFGREHALLFRGWRGRITIVRDNDLPGAWGACRAYDALRAVGIPATRLRVARGRCTGDGADLRDHLRRHDPDDLIGEGIAKVRGLAAKATPESFAHAGYGMNPATGFVWVGADEVAQLRKWKARAAS